MSLSARKPTATQKIRPRPRSFARSRPNGLTSKSKFLSARSQRAARPLILQLNNDMRSELWQASGGGWIKGSNKPKKRLPRETMGKDPSGGRGMSEGGEWRRGIKPKGKLFWQPSTTGSLKFVSTRGPVLCLFVLVFFRFRNTREQDPQNSQHSVTFNVLGEPSAKAVSGLNQRGKFPSQSAVQPRVTLATTGGGHFMQIPRCAAPAVAPPLGPAAWARFLEASAKTASA